jgi:hypothetical protein
MGLYHGDGKSRSLWIVTGSRESEPSGVNGDGERDVVAVVDEAVIVDTGSASVWKFVNDRVSREKITTSFGNFRL